MAPTERLKPNPTTESMSSIIEALPGIELPISEISRQLREMWKGESGPDHQAPSEFRASQLNLIIHFGADTPVEEAQERFSAAIDFTQRYPGRIIVLAAAPNPKCSPSELRGKLFTQCYIGETQREMCCCEALLLEYAPKEPHLLFNQVSIWLESDLPVYHWFHRISVTDVQNKYLAFVKNSKRVLYDSSLDGSDFSDIPTPHPWRIRDLADARILPLKQSIGQVLSTIDPATLGEGLLGVSITGSEAEAAQIRSLAKWITLCLDKMAETAMPSGPSWNVETRLTREPHTALRTEFIYTNGNQIVWELAPSGREATTATQMGSRKLHHRAVVQPTSPKQTLAEAVFLEITERNIRLKSALGLIKLGDHEQRKNLLFKLWSESKIRCPSQISPGSILALAYQLVSRMESLLRFSSSRSARAAASPIPT
jgi:hypothetical protein